MVAPRKKSTTQRIDSVTLLFPPRQLILDLTDLSLRYRGLVLVEGSNYGGDTFNLLFDSTWPTLESSVTLDAFNSGGRSFSHLVCVSVTDHDENPTRSEDHARKLSDASQDEGTIQRNASIHR